MGLITAMVKSVGIKHQRIMVWNSQANGQVKRANWTLKDIIRRKLTKYPESKWSDHMPTALMLMRFTSQKTLGIPPFTLVTGRAVVPPRHILNDERLDYDSILSGDLEQYISQQLARLSAIESFVHQQLKTTNTIEPTMETLFQFKPGNLVLRKTHVLGKLAPKRNKPYRGVRVLGRQRQRCELLRIADGRTYTHHARKLVPFLGDVEDVQQVQVTGAGDGDSRYDANPKSKWSRPPHERAC